MAKLWKSMLGATLAWCLATAAQASTLTFVGSWQVDEGPDWQTQPLAYSAQEAAALLFGGEPVDYVLSTVSDLVSEINNLAWYSVLGIAGGIQLAADVVQPADGYYFSGGPSAFSTPSVPVSAYVLDNAIGSQFVNYAFRVPTIGSEPPTTMPLPSGAPLIVGGLAVFGVLRFRQYAQRAAQR